VKILIFLTLLVLVGCSAKKQDKTTATIFISSRDFVTSETGNYGDYYDYYNNGNYLDDFYSDNDSNTILYMINKDKNKQRTIILTNNSISVDIEFGNWDFAIISWGQGYDLKCGKTSKNFNSIEDSLNIYIDESTCNSNFFSPSSARTAEGLKYFGIINCINIDGMDPNEEFFCESPQRAGAESYRIKVLSHDYMNIPELPNLNFDSVTYASSSCFPAEPAPYTFTDTNAPIPLGTDLFKMPIVLEIFSDQNCTQNPTVRYFPFGFGNSPTTGNSQIISNESKNFIHTNFETLVINETSGFSFDSSSPSATTATVTLYNNTSQPLSNINSNIASPFSVTDSTCPSNLGINESCELTIQYDPGTPGTFPGNLAITYLAGTETKIVNILIGSQLYVPPNSGDLLTAVNFNLTGLDEDAIVTTNIPYSAQAGNIPTKCDITELNEIKITEKCSCNNGICSVTFRSKKPHYNGTAFFKYTLSEENFTSNEATTNISFNPSADNLIAHNISAKAISTTLNIKLEYTDPDSVNGALASNNTCTLFGEVNISSFNCTCNTNGECFANVTRTSLSSMSGFKYKIFRNDGSYSNEAYAYIYLNANSFIAVNQGRIPNETTVDPTDEIMTSMGKVSQIFPSDQFLYLATSNGVFSSQDNGISFSLLFNFQQLGSSVVNSLFVESGLSTFVGKNNGLHIMNSSEVFEPEDISGKIVRDIWKNEFGTVFASTDSGLLISHNNGVTFYNRIAGLNINKTRSIGPSKIYAGSNSGLWISNNSGYSFTLHSSIIPLSSGTTQSIGKVNDIFIKEDGVVFLATDSGIRAFREEDIDNNGYEELVVPSLYPNINIGNFPVRSVHLSKHGVIYAATSNGVAISLNNGTNFTYQNNTNGLSSNDVYSVITDSSGSLFAGTINGLSVSYSNLYLTFLNSSNLMVNSYHIGNFFTPSSYTQVIQIKNLGNKPFQNFAINTVGDINFTTTQPNHNCGTEISPGEICQITITVNSSLPIGPKNGTLQIIQSGQLISSLPLSGNLQSGP